jgi:hypothetical protein
MNRAQPWARSYVNPVGGAAVAHARELEVVDVVRDDRRSTRASSREQTGSCREARLLPRSLRRLRARRTRKDEPGNPRVRRASGRPAKTFANLVSSAPSGRTSTPLTRENRSRAGGTRTPDHRYWSCMVVDLSAMFRPPLPLPPPHHGPPESESGLTPGRARNRGRRKWPWGRRVTAERVDPVDQLSEPREIRCTTSGERRFQIRWRVSRQGCTPPSLPCP